LLEQALTGQGALAMIGGEPGVGKTRLAEELLLEAKQREMTALIGHCYEMEGAPPYVPFVEMLEAAARMFPPDALRGTLGESAPEVAKLMPELRRMFPDIPAAPELPPEQERRYLFNGMRDFLGRAGQAQPLLLVLDDLHWADSSTLLLVEHIAQQIREMPVLIIGPTEVAEVLFTLVRSAERASAYMVVWLAAIAIVAVGT
jgi:predicted ATPase